LRYLLLLDGLQSTLFVADYDLKPRRDKVEKMPHKALLRAISGAILSGKVKAPP